MNSSSSVTLAWTAPAPNGGTAITGYRIYHVIGGSADLIATILHLTC